MSGFVARARAVAGDLPFKILYVLREKP